LRRGFCLRAHIKEYAAKKKARHGDPWRALFEISLVKAPETPLRRAFSEKAQRANPAR
jgi:hypothetical protein